MNSTKDSLLATHRFKVFVTGLIFQVGCVFLALTIIAAGGLGYLGWSHMQAINSPYPFLTNLYFSGCVALVACAAGTALMLLMWQVQVNRRVDDRNYANLFLYFCDEYLSHVKKSDLRHKSHEELIAACHKAHVDVTERTLVMAKDLDTIMKLYTEANLDAVFADLAGFIGTINRHGQRQADALLSKEDNQSERDMQFAEAKRLVTNYLSTQLVNKMNAANDPLNAPCIERIAAE